MHVICWIQLINASFSTFFRFIIILNSIKHSKATPHTFSWKSTVKWKQGYGQSSLYVCDMGRPWTTINKVTHVCIHTEPLFSVIRNLYSVWITVDSEKVHSEFGIERKKYFIFQICSHSKRNIPNTPKTRLGITRFSIDKCEVSILVRVYGSWS